MANVLGFTRGDARVEKSSGLHTSIAVIVRIGDSSVQLSREEAAQLAADLLDAIEGRSAA